MYDSGLIKTCTYLFIFVLFISLQQDVIGQFGEVLRTCKSSKVDIRKVDMEIKFKAVPVLNQNNDSFQLFILFEWTVNTSAAAKDLTLDGFAVHFLDTETKRNISLPRIPIETNSSCLSGENHMWIRTANKTGCDTANTDHISDCDVAPMDACLCTLPNCSVFTLGYPLPCRGSPQFLQDGYHQTLPPTVNSIMYPAEFHITYEFTITPYYREFINQAPFSKLVESIDNCADILEETTGSREAANSLCCEQGAQSLTAHNFTFSKSLPKLSKDPNGTLANKTVTWLSPSATSVTTGFRILIRATTGKASPGLASFTDIIDIPLFDDETINRTTEIGVDNCTYDILFKHQMTMYNLVIGETYVLQVTPIFEDPELEKWCERAICKTTEHFFVEDVDNICNEDYGLCVSSATCSLIPDPTTEREATCSCDLGLAGNGVDPAIGGSGCSESDECLSNNTGCAVGAICTDRMAPETGVNCTCSPGYDGDGLVSGSGCRSRAILALSIALPIVVILVIVIILIIWFMKKRENEKLKQLLERYVPDTEHGILTSFINTDCKENEGPWAPTFGDQWEIDRGSIHFGEIIGRGNYGVVHKAWLKDNEHAQNGSAKNGKSAFLNGGFYDPISSVPTDDSTWENTTLVAVKSLQESTNHQNNLENFLMEIAFMLNINQHENIVQIHGCCTTEEPVYLVAEYLQYGDLLHFLWDAREPSKGSVDPVYDITVLSLCKMARDVARAMEYLQKIRIIHGDIAARNILVGKDGICKLSDFGLANDVYRYGNVTKGRREQIVPYKWISPERMMSGEVPITKHSDAWSFGNLLYEMFTLGCPPHPGVKLEELFDKLKEGYRMKQPRACNDQIYSLMRKCWEWKPSSRPNFSVIVKFLSNVMLQLPVEVTNKQHFAGSLNVLNKEDYASEAAMEMQLKGNVCVNRNVTLVENENEMGTRAI